MKIIAPNKIKEQLYADAQKPEREFLLDKTFNLKISRECFFMELKVGRDYRMQDTRCRVSIRRKKINTAAIIIVGFLTLHIIVGSVVYTLYTLKSLAGLDIFPGIHFFHF